MKFLIKKITYFFSKYIYIFIAFPYAHFTDFFCPIWNYDILKKCGCMHLDGVCVCRWQFLVTQNNSVNVRQMLRIKENNKNLFSDVNIGNLIIYIFSNFWSRTFMSKPILQTLSAILLKQLFRLLCFFDSVFMLYIILLLVLATRSPSSY